MNIGSLFMLLGFKTDNAQLKEFNSQIETTRGRLLKIGAIGAGVVYGVNRFIQGSSAQAVALQNFENQTGFAREELEKFYRVAAAFNTEITFDQAEGAFQGLADAIADAKEGKGPLAEAARMGLRDITGMTPLGVIRELRRAYNDPAIAWPDDVKRRLIESIGLGREFMPVMKTGADEFEKALGNARTLTDEQVQSLVKYEQALVKVKQSWELFKAEISAGPAEDIANWLQKLPDDLKNVELASWDVARGIAAMITPLSRLPILAQSLSQHYLEKNLVGTKEGDAIGDWLLDARNGINNAIGGAGNKGNITDISNITMWLFGGTEDEIKNSFQDRKQKTKDFLERFWEALKAPYVDAMDGSMRDAIMGSDTMRILSDPEYGRQRLKDVMFSEKYLNGAQINTTNNIEVNSTAPADVVAQEVYNKLQQEQNRGTIAEFPNTAYGESR